jgi:hypothetical protein
MTSPLMDALQQFDATEANLEKLDRLWKAIAALFPSNLEFGDNADYEERSLAYEAILAAVPMIDGWKPSVAFYEWNDISQMRLDASEVDAEAQIRVENELHAPAKQLREYRFRFARKRRELVRAALTEQVSKVDSDIAEVRKATNFSKPGSKMEGVGWDRLREHLDQIGVLLGSTEKRPTRWSDLRRHLGFGMVQDFEDIERLDWPSTRDALTKGIYEDDEPIHVGVEDLNDVVALKPAGHVITKLIWSQLDEEAFERLIFGLISNEPGYEDPQWLMQTKAPDSGRDISIMRVIRDALSGTSRQRVIIQCRHWQARSIGPSDVATVRDQMLTWPDPPVDELIFATSGRFTEQAVRIIETHNASRPPLRISMWPESHLERLLAARPDLIAQFGLR